MESLSPQLLSSVLFATLEFVSIAFIPLVLLRKKEAASAAAWILLLIFLPLLGVFLFWFLGRNRVRRPVQRKVSSNVAVRKRLSATSKQWLRARLDSLLMKQPKDLQGVMRLAAQVGSMSVSTGNEVKLLVGAEETYASQIEAIENATQTVFMEYYIVRPDSQGRRFCNALVAAAKRGVQVCVLYDGFGSRGVRRKLFSPLVAVGGQVKPFFPLSFVRRAWTLNLRNHRKVMIVDGRLGFAGGINIGEQFLDWRDIHLELIGPAVRDLSAVFAEDWYFATGKMVQVQPVNKDRGNEGAVVQFVQSGPDATHESIHRLYFSAVASAQERVCVITPYFVPDRALLTALQTAALRGVDVRLILPSFSNHKMTFHAGRSYYDELLDTGVRIYEFESNMLHSKAMIIDGKFATVGSANFDTRSFRLNFELIAVLYDAFTVGKLERIFMHDLGMCRAVERERWQRRPLRFRLIEGVARLCSPLL